MAEIHILVSRFERICHQNVPVDYQRQSVPYLFYPQHVHCYTTYI